MANWQINPRTLEKEIIEPEPEPTPDPDAAREGKPCPNCKKPLSYNPHWYDSNLHCTHCEWGL